MDKGKPLISIGVPTYNRPQGLRRALGRIMSQDYSNLEIIVSDNCSPSAETEELIKEFQKNDPRVVFFRQPENKGPAFNFHFVQEKSKGDYFIWAADDDEWVGDDFLSSLMEYAPYNILTFPEAVVDSGDCTIELLKAYTTCNSQIDYVRTFCKLGWGYPVYGLYNIKLFKERKLEFGFDRDLTYYNEGIFLHRLFLAGPVKYVGTAGIKYNSNGTQPSKEIKIDNFITYFKRMVTLYRDSNELSCEHRSELLRIIIDTNTAYCRSLFTDLSGERVQQMSVSKPPLSILQRLRRSLSIMLNGN